MKGSQERRRVGETELTSSLSLSKVRGAFPEPSGVGALCLPGRASPGSSGGLALTVPSGAVGWGAEKGLSPGSGVSWASQVTPGSQPGSSAFSRAKGCSQDVLCRYLSCWIPKHLQGTLAPLPPYGLCSQLHVS